MQKSRKRNVSVDDNHCAVLRWIPELWRLVIVTHSKRKCLSKAKEMWEDQESWKGSQGKQKVCPKDWRPNVPNMYKWKFIGLYKERAGSVVKGTIWQVPRDQIIQGLVACNSRFYVWGCEPPWKSLESQRVLTPACEYSYWDKLSMSYNQDCVAVTEMGFGVVRKGLEESLELLNQRDHNKGSKLWYSSGKQRTY